MKTSFTQTWPFSTAFLIALGCFGASTASASMNDDLRFIQRLIKKPVAQVGVGSPCLDYQAHSLAEELEQMQKSEVEKLIADLRNAFDRLEFKTYSAQSLHGEFHYVKMNMYNDPRSPMMYGPIRDGGKVVLEGTRAAKNLLQIADAGRGKVAAVLTGEVSFGPVRATQYFWDPLNHYFEESRAAFHGRMRDTVEAVNGFTEKTRGSVDVSVVPALESLRTENGYYPQLLEWYLATSVNDLRGCSEVLSWTDILDAASKPKPALQP